MSGIICGFINRDNSKASLERGKYMIQKLSSYKLDSIKYVNEHHVFMGCGLQYITNESKNEILPLYDTDRGLIITADAIMDNREELLGVFNISKYKWQDVADSELIIRAYEKWGQDCPKYLVGDFSFVIWDTNKKELFCARDHVGARTFYYYYDNHIFAFCTVMKPLVDVLSKRRELNERWITDFLALPGLDHESECNETIYQNIYQLPPAYTCTIQHNKLKKVRYWNPIKAVKQLKLESDEAYEEAFNKVLSEAVDCRLRSTGEVGITLSGGLDSGSVACIAANKLKENNKRLKAFSAIPMVGYREHLPKSCIANESEYIEAISRQTGNIDVNYCRSEHKNSVTDIPFFVHMLEQPYKIVENMFWYYEIIKKASQSGCKVVLGAGHGNYTISRGEFMTQVVTLYKKKRFVTLIKEIKSCSLLHHVSLNRVIKLVVKAVAPHTLKVFYNRLKHGKYNRFTESPVSAQLLKKWQVEKRFSRKGINPSVERKLNHIGFSKASVNPIVFSHVGAIMTKIALDRGIIIRDPTKDKRVIEFCLSLPMDQFVRHGIERNLIRRAMKGILPESVRMSKERGVQSADWVQRLEPQWSSLYANFKHLLQNEDIETYIDQHKLSECIILGDGLMHSDNLLSLRMLIISQIFTHFIQDYDAR